MKSICQYCLAKYAEIRQNAVKFVHYFSFLCVGIVKIGMLVRKSEYISR